LKYLDKISAIFCFFLGLAVLAGGIRLGLRVELDMGPGFFPLVAGGILSLLSIVLLFQSLVKKETSTEQSSFWVNPQGWKSVLLTLFAISVYPFTLNRLGFLLSTFFLLFFLFLVIARKKWWVAGVGGIITAIVVYIIFEIWLRANFPRGILAF